MLTKSKLKLARSALSEGLLRPVSRLKRNSVNASRRRKGNIPTRSVLPFRELSAFVSDNYCLLGARADDSIDVVFAIFDRRELSLQRSLLAIGI